MESESAEASPQVANEKKKRLKKSTTAEAEVHDIEELDQIRNDGVKKHKMATNTRDSYGGYIKRLRAWGKKTPGYELAFEGNPKVFSPKALANYISLRCMKDDRGKSTADGVHAAWKKHWEEL